jgi:hypothetical protein
MGNKRSRMACSKPKAIKSHERGRMFNRRAQPSPDGREKRGHSMNPESSPQTTADPNAATSRAFDEE